MFSRPPIPGGCQARQCGRRRDRRRGPLARVAHGLGVPGRQGRVHREAHQGGPWESRKIVEATAKYGRIIQAGTQRRSDPGVEDAVRYVKEGHLGKIQWIRTHDFALRTSIGRRMPWYPDWLDYDMYCGPMAMSPLERDQLHYDWRFMWNPGTGDLPNLGIHELDMARRFDNYDLPPRRVMCVGGRYLNPDVGETPNTSVTVFEYPDAPPLLFELRGLPAKPGVNYMDAYHGHARRGMRSMRGRLLRGEHRRRDLRRQNRQIKKIYGDGGAGHMANFVDAVRSRRSGDLTAPIAVGFASTAICLYGNISYRTGKHQ